MIKQMSEAENVLFERIFVRYNFSVRGAIVSNLSQRVSTLRYDKELSRTF